MRIGASFASRPHSAADVDARERATWPVCKQALTVEFAIRRAPECKAGGTENTTPERSPKYEYGASAIDYDALALSCSV
jgi:hypothetical protein